MSTEDDVRRLVMVLWAAVGLLAGCFLAILVEALIQ